MNHRHPAHSDPAPIRSAGWLDATQLQAHCATEHGLSRPVPDRTAEARLRMAHDTMHALRLAGGFLWP